MTRLGTVIVIAFAIVLVIIGIAWLLPIGRMTYSVDTGITVSTTTEAGGPVLTALSRTSVASTTSATVPPAPASFVVTHIATPQPLKAVYMTACTASVPRLRDKVLSTIAGTEVDAVAIDLKDYTGTISYASTSMAMPSPAAMKVKAGCRIADLPQFLAKLHSLGLYVIARITVFQDPLYAAARPDLAIGSVSHPGTVWRDTHGLSYIEAGAKPFWDYIIGIGREAYSIGFDELNFDYIRYPSDGDLSDMKLAWSGDMKKADVLAGFFSYLHDAFAPKGIPISADLFGLTAVAENDLGIGQIIEDALPYFDYVAPMVYPSHFASGFLGYAKPAQHPYEVIKYSMDRAIAKAEATTTREHMPGSEPLSTSTPLMYPHDPVSKDKIRPWLQAFDLGAVYTPEMVRSQMQATYDAGLTSWMLWNASSVYDSASLLPK